MVGILTGHIDIVAADGIRIPGIMTVMSDAIPDCCLLYTSVMNSVVQMRNDGKKNSNGAIICGFSNGFKAPSGGQFWYGGIKSITCLLYTSDF